MFKENFIYAGVIVAPYEPALNTNWDSYSNIMFSLFCITTMPITSCGTSKVIMAVHLHFWTHKFLKVGRNLIYRSLCIKHRNTNVKVTLHFATLHLLWCHKDIDRIWNALKHYFRKVSKTSFEASSRISYINITSPNLFIFVTFQTFFRPFSRARTTLVDKALPLICAASH